MPSHATLHSPELNSYLESSHLSARTRQILRARLPAPEVAADPLLSCQALNLLDSVADDLLPQTPLLGPVRLPLAMMAEQALGGPGDGWRYAALPPDPEAWEKGLATLALHAAQQIEQKNTPPQGEPSQNWDENWQNLPEEQRGTLLDSALAGTLPNLPAQPLTPQQMAWWSRDLRAVILEVFLAHPLVQERLGCSAELTGSDEVFQGFENVGPNSRAPFEPSTPQAFTHLPETLPTFFCAASPNGLEASLSLEPAPASSVSEIGDRTP